MQLNQQIEEMTVYRKLKYKYIEEKDINLENYYGLVYITFFPNGMIYAGFTTKIPFTKKYEKYFGSGQGDKFKEAIKQYRGNGLYKKVVCVVYKDGVKTEPELDVLLRRIEVCYQLATDCCNPEIGYNKAIGDPLGLGFIVNPMKNEENRKRVSIGNKIFFQTEKGEKRKEEIREETAEYRNSEEGKLAEIKRIEALKTPEYREKRSGIATERMSTPEGKEQVKKAGDVMKEPEYRKEASERGKKKMETIEGQEHQKRMTELAATPEAQKKLKDKLSDPKVKKKQSDSAKKHRATPKGKEDTKKAVAASIEAGRTPNRAAYFDSMKGNQMGKNNKGKKRTEEQKEKLKGKKWITNGLESIALYTDMDFEEYQKLGYYYGLTRKKKNIKRTKKSDK